MPTITPFIAVLTCSSLILGLGLPHNYCDEEANEENWDSADQDEWIAGACVQLLGSWRRHRICILGRDNLNEARVKLTPPAIASEYKRHEYSFYMFAPVDEEQREAKSAVVKEYMDALWKLSSEALSKDVRSLVSVSLLARDHRGSASTTLTSACPCVFSVHAGARLCRKARHEQCRARQHLPAAFTQLVASAGCRLLITSIASRSLGRCNFRCPRRILECQQM